MLRPSSHNYSAAVGGLVTDGNDLAVQSESTLEESNYELLRDGTRRRRRAFIEENLRPDHRGVDNQSAHTCYIWKTPAKKDNESLLVEQRNGFLYFSEIDHDNPTKMRDNERLDPIDLRLFGEYERDTLRNPQFPCTYAEGNGALYVFNQAAGTIKVELVQQGASLRATPVGTWIRDYEGADETLNADSRYPLPNPLTEWEAGVPYLNTAEEVQITNDIPAERAYNYSNTGWDAKGVSDFLKQSIQSYTVQHPLIKDQEITKVGKVANQVPALTDRYLSGRRVDIDGEDTFSYKQLVESKDNKALPPYGSRVRYSALHPAGSLVGLPTDMKVKVVPIVSPSNPGLVILDITFDERVYHTEGRSNDQVAVFIHYMTFSLLGTNAAGGTTTYRGGFSGVLEATIKPGTNGRGLLAQYRNRYLGTTAYTNFTLTGFHAHPGPEYFPHQVLDNSAAYDYRTQDRPASGAYFAGRLWQTGDTHSRLYYSQMVEAGTQSAISRGVCKESLCYAAADPTDGFDSQLVATDGGYLNLSDSGTHYGLASMGNSLFVLTDNGIWSISPGQSGYFMANDFRVTKLSNAEVLGYRSWVLVDNELHIGTDEGIIRITSEGIESLTDRRIRNRYDDIIVEGRQVIAAYDPESNLVRWAFPDQFGQMDIGSTLGVTMLTYHRLHDSWFQYDLPEQYTIADMCVIPYTAKVETYNKFRYLAVAKNFDVLTLGAPLSSDYAVEAKLGDTGFDEWVAFHDERFKDFLDSTSTPQAREPMPAYMLTNHIMIGEAYKFTKINYLVAHNRNVTTNWIDAGDGSLLPNIPGSTEVSARWDWFDQPHQGKYSNPHQTYRFRRSYFQDATGEDERGEPNLVSKIKVRGRGREFRLYWEASGHNDSHLTGWSLEGQTMETV